MKALGLQVQLLLFKWGKDQNVQNSLLRLCFSNILQINHVTKNSDCSGTIFFASSREMILKHTSALASFCHAPLRSLLLTVLDQLTQKQ